MPTVRAASVRVVRQTCGVDIEITTDFIRLGQLLKYANLVADGAEAKSLIAAGGVRVDGEPENRRGRQVSVNWYYDPRNERVVDLADEFREDCSFPFEIAVDER